jgi:uncharacterized protein (DUF3084 family)
MTNAQALQPGQLCAFSSVGLLGHGHESLIFTAAQRTQLHSSAAALEVRAARAEQQLAEAQRQADAARSESRRLAASLASAEARLTEAQQSQVG